MAVRNTMRSALVILMSLMAASPNLGARSPKGRLVPAAPIAATISVFVPSSLPEATSLTISRWDKAPGPKDGASTESFLFFDADRFFVQVYNPASDGNGVSNETTTLTLESHDFEDKVVDTLTVTMTEEGDSGLYRVDEPGPFILVAWKNDDEFALAGKAQGSAGDRSLRVMDPAKAQETTSRQAKLEVGGSVKFSSPGATSKTLPIDLAGGPFEVKTFKIHGVILRSDGDPVATPAQFREAVANANMVWANAGVRFVISSIETIAPPRDVVIGPEGQKASVKNNADITTAPKPGELTDEEKALLLGAEDADPNTIDVIVTGVINIRGQRNAIAGRSYPVGEFSPISLPGGTTRSITGATVIHWSQINRASNSFGDFTLGHELGHNLLKSSVHRHIGVSITDGQFLPDDSLHFKADMSTPFRRGNEVLNATAHIDYSVTTSSSGATPVSVIEAFAEAINSNPSATFSIGEETRKVKLVATTATLPQEILMDVLFENGAFVPLNGFTVEITSSKGSRFLTHNLTPHLLMKPVPDFKDTSVDVSKRLDAREVFIARKWAP